MAARCSRIIMTYIDERGWVQHYAFSKSFQRRPIDGETMNGT